MHGWFKPKGRFEFEGAQWVTNGHVAIRCVDANRRELPEVLGDGVALIRSAMSSCKTAGTVTTSDLGRAVFNAMPTVFNAMPIRHVFQAHLIALVSDAYPSIEWRGSEDNHDPMLGLADGAPIALVMPYLDWVKSNECFAPCPTCDGNGGPECEDCYGNGESECDECGHESECRTCRGKGYDGGCAACGGTGRWTVEMDRVAK